MSLPSKRVGKPLSVRELCLLALIGALIFATKAALAAIGRAPGSLRSHFAFMSLKGYKQIIPNEKAPRVAPRHRFGVSPEQIWKDMLLESAEKEKKNIPPIIATDISPEAIENAQANAHAAGVHKFIQFKACDFAETPIPDTFTPDLTPEEHKKYPYNLVL